MNPRSYLTTALATAMVASLLLIAAPAGAAAAMPRIMLKGGAAVVGFTYTATATERAFPAGSSPRYQWYQRHQGSRPVRAGSHRRCDRLSATPSATPTT